MIHCTKTQELLGLYHDGELSPKKRALVEEHLAGCESCSLELEEIGVLGDGLRAPVEEALAKVSFDGLWDRVQVGLKHSAPPPLHQRAYLWLRELVACNKTALVSGVAGAVAAMLVFLPMIVLRQDVQTVSPLDLSVVSDTMVDSVESATGTVLVSQDPHDRTTVIWLLDGDVQETEPEAVTDDDVEHSEEEIVDEF